MNALIQRVEEYFIGHTVDAILAKMVKGAAALQRLSARLHTKADATYAAAAQLSEQAGDHRNEAERASRVADRFNDLLK